MLRNAGSTGHRLCAIAIAFFIHFSIICIFVHQKNPPTTGVEGNRLYYFIIHPEKPPMEIAPPDHVNLSIPTDLSTIKPGQAELHFQPWNLFLPSPMNSNFQKNRIATSIYSIRDYVKSLRSSSTLRRVKREVSKA